MTCVVQRVQYCMFSAPATEVCLEDTWLDWVVNWEYSVQYIMAEGPIKQEFTERKIPR